MKKTPVQIWPGLFSPRSDGQAEQPHHEAALAIVGLPDCRRSVGLPPFLAEKLYSHQCGDNDGTDHGGYTNLLRPEAEVMMGNVCKRERAGGRRDHSHQKSQKSPDRRFYPANMRQRLGRSS
jgi:hypothetical protein